MDLKNKTVPHKDRNEKIAQIDVALRAVGFHFSYPTVEIIRDVIIQVDNGDLLDIRDMCTIERTWQKKWENYFKDLKNAKQKRKTSTSK